MLNKRTLFSVAFTASFTVQIEEARTALSLRSPARYGLFLCLHYGQLTHWAMAPATQYPVHFQGSGVRKPSSMGVASGEGSAIPNVSHFCLKIRCFWRAAPQINEDFLAPPILMHWAMPPATLYIWALGPGSRNWKFSSRPWPNWNFFAVPSSTHRVLQLESNLVDMAAFLHAFLV